MQPSQAEFQRNVATDVAMQAGQLLREHFGTALNVRHKGEIDLVTEADEAAERLIVDELRRQFPLDGILAEEGGGGDVDRERLWIIDPLDGTTNFAHGYPIFGVSIALEIAGELALGVVYQPVLNELFTAVKGGGAFLNGAPIRVSATERLDASLLCSGFSYDRGETRAALPLWARMVLSAQGVRRDGAAALDLCYVAAGRFDGFWERPLQAWDVAAGALIVVEAGGLVSDYEGNPHQTRGRQVVASNGRIHGQMLQIISSERAENLV